MGIKVVQGKSKFTSGLSHQGGEEGAIKNNGGELSWWINLFLAGKDFKTDLQLILNN